MSSCSDHSECKEHLFNLDRVVFENISETGSPWSEGVVQLNQLIDSVSIYGLKYSQEHPKWKKIWQLSNTVFGPCWTMTPQEPKSMLSSKVIDINVIPQYPCSHRIRRDDTKFLANLGNIYNDCDNIGKYCNTSCEFEKAAFTSFFELGLREFVILLHEPHSSPTIHDRNLMVPFTSNDLFLHESREIRIIVREKITKLSTTCLSKGQSSAVCKSKLVEKILTDGECVFFTDYNKNKSNHHCLQRLLYFRTEVIRNWMHSSLFNIDATAHCLPKCMEASYEADVSSYTIDKARHEKRMHRIILTSPRKFYEQINEVELTSLTNLMASLGGAMGLTMGIGLISIWNSIINCLSFLVNKLLCVLKISFKGNNLSQENTRKLLKYGGYLLCLFGLTLSVLYHSISFSEYKTLSVIRPIESLRFPSFFVCPGMPVDVKSLKLFFDLNFTSIGEEIRLSSACNPIDRKHCSKDAVVSYFLDNLPGIWDKNLSLADVWQKVRVSSEEIFDETYIKWNYIVTSAGYCFQMQRFNDSDNNKFDLAFNPYYHNPVKDLVYYSDISLGITGFSLQPEILIIGRGSETHPVMADKNEGVLVREKYDQDVTIAISTTEINYISTPKSPCRPPPYNQEECFDKCLVNSAIEIVGCSLPYIKSSTPNCKTQNQYQKFPKGGLMNDWPEWMRQNESVQSSCIKDCPKGCYSKTTNVIQKISKYTREKDQPDVQYDEEDSFVVEQILMLSIYRLSLEFLGLLGLYFGWTIIDTVALVIEAFHAWIHQRWKIDINRLNVFRKLVKMCLQVIALLVTCYVLISEAFEFLYQRPVHTVYSVENMTPREVPSVTVCRWPPFDNSRLFDLGITADIDRYCGYNYFLMYDCDYNLLDKEILNMALDLGNVTLEDIWRNATWNLDDIIFAYNVSDQEVITGNETVDTKYWQSTSTAMGQCYTFTPNAFKNDIIGFKVKAFTKNPSFVYGDDYTIHDILSFRSGQVFTYNFVFHEKGDKILYPYERQSIEIKEQESKLLRFEYAIQKFSQLKDSNCTNDQYYSEKNCKEMCILQKYCRFYQCRMPFMFETEFNYELCNISTFRKFPKYRDSLEDNPRHIEFQKQCSKICSVSCTKLKMKLSLKNVVGHYSLSDKYKSKIELYSKTSFYESFNETYQTSLSAATAEVGGVISALLGASAFSVMEAISLFVWKLVDKYQAGRN